MTSVHFDQPYLTCDESAWVRALDYAIHAETPATFRKRLAGWLDFFPDVRAVLDDMGDDWAAYQELRRGLQCEREKTFAGEEWAKRFGAVLIPDNAIRASQLSNACHVPWGAALARVAGVL